MPVFFVIIVVMFWLAIMFAILFSIHRTISRNSSQPSENHGREYKSPNRIPTRQTPKETPSQIRRRVTRKALERAAVEVDSLPYQLTDIGLLTHQEGTLHIIRDEKLPMAAPYLRPFVEITAPEEMELPIILQILDEHRKVIYRDGDSYPVHGKSVILPKTQLSLKGKEINPVHQWSIWVLVGEVPFAIHPFEWHVGTEENLILKELSDDGEITDRLRQIVEEAEMGEVSLNELLADQHN